MSIFGRRSQPCAPTLVDQIASLIFEAEWQPLEWDGDTTSSDKRQYRETAEKVIRLVRDRDRSGEADKTGTGLAEGKSPAPQGDRPTSSPITQPGHRHDR